MLLLITNRTALTLPTICRKWIFTHFNMYKIVLNAPDFFKILPYYNIVLR